MDRDLEVHAHGGGCAEINVLELVWSENEEADPDKGPPAPRVAIWVRRQGRPVGSERNTPPCSWYGFAGAGYGCADIIRAYGVEAIDKNAAPDPAGEDDWTFSLAENPRPLCERPY